MKTVAGRQKPRKGQTDENCGDGRQIETERADRRKLWRWQTDGN